MGTDNLFHKRRGRKAKELGRRRARREPYAKVLIVCEGEKTEPRYFDDLRNHHTLNSANIEITGESDSSPLGIWEYARQRYREERDAGDPFDYVYCVFDKDRHRSYVDACERIASARPGDTFFAIKSVPCFEYWLLLHYSYTTRPFAALPGNSAGDQVVTELRKYMPHYTKGQDGLSTELLEQLPQAKAYAARALDEATRNATDNPSTEVHQLVAFLEAIKDNR